jgi:hypothetical protein
MTVLICANTGKQVGDLTTSRSFPNQDAADT